MDKVIPTGIKGTDSFSVVLSICFTVFPAILIITLLSPGRVSSEYDKS